MNKKSNLDLGSNGRTSNKLNLNLGNKMKDLQNNETVAVVLNEKGLISSLAICQEINRLRVKEGNRAELKHFNLLNIIRDEFSEEMKDLENGGESNGLNILAVKYKDKKGEFRQAYNLSPNYAKQILLRESKFVRKAIIKLLDRLEEKLRNGYVLPKNYKEALEMLIEGEKEKEKLEVRNQKNILALEKSEQRVEMLIHQGTIYTATNLAKELGFRSAVQFNKLLHREGVQFMQNGVWMLYAKYSEEDYTSTKQQELDNGAIIYNRVWTGKGRTFVISLLLKLGYLEVVVLKDGTKRYKFIGECKD